jgi:replicative DNA helicase
MPDVASRVRSSDVFYDLRNQIIYSTISELLEGQKLVDVISIQSLLRDRNQLDRIGGISHLSSLIDASPSPANAPFYLEIVLEKYARRKVIQHFTSGVREVYETERKASETVDSVAQGISELSTEISGESDGDIQTDVRNALEYFETVQQEPEALQGIPTGFMDLDRMISGLKGGEMFILAARPSMGKTSLAMNIGEFVAVDQKIPVLVQSMEMKRESLTRRLICARARVNMRDIRNGQLDFDTNPRIVRAATEIAKSPLKIDDSQGLNILQLRSRWRRFVRRFGVRVVILDYLQLLSGLPGRQENRNMELTRISNGIKAILNELNIAGIILSQLNRDLDKEKNRKPRLSDLRECGAIEQDADTVAMLYTPEDEPDGKLTLPVNLIIRKQREGPTGEVQFIFNKAITRYLPGVKIAERDTEMMLNARV